ncbi:CRISPR-associated helicase Cas3' [Nocardiopsis ansamitocini]|uniref:CRISPR-associated helicase/endonuclease Cas3 n=1 Tax=Nocardiopsis ansamitocini TaxID=1670832 RepID=A0A9W6P7N6_9ACTN|nr:CRISPR-associated helicase Cas3' [Nocardiopsis ansamitocini]GLU48690.1 CRISPR-associated helicase/endonuclease Cas3 [Nocardiopsis ansamitocini]
MAADDCFGGEPGQAVDLALWGKERGLDGARYPLLHHCLDTAAAALVLWREYLSPGMRANLAAALTDPAAPDKDRAGRTIAFWAGLHDLGKLTHSFQSQAKGVDLSGYPPEPDGGEARPHATVSGHWLAVALKTLGYGTGHRDPAPLVAQLLSGHHGRFAEHPTIHATDPLASLGFAPGPWEEQRQALLETVFAALDRPGQPDALPAPEATVICGLVILADWLVSQRGFVLARLADTAGADGPPSPAAHFAASLQRVPRLLDEAGLRPITVAPATFAESFPFITTPNGLQRSLAEHLPALCGQGGLVLVTAPMGEGKTEAALHAADLLGAATGRPGRYLALPTMATADQMYGRLKEYANARAEPAPPGRPSTLALLHAMAWLNPEYVPDHELQVSTVLSSSGPGSADRFAATDWLLGPKRGLLASWSVGTVDQALMAALRAKHTMLRLFGLAQKVVIVDEAHAVDPYMQVLLERLLHWLGRLGVPVVLLSATLHHRTANSLVKAYLSGCPGKKWRRSDPAPVTALSYPGWLHAAPSRVVTTSGELEPGPIPATEREPLTVELAGVPVRNGRADRIGVLKARLAGLVEQGGCAAVVCTTVADSQATVDALAEWFAGLGARAPELRLLHARFPNQQRTAITEEITGRFGKNGPAKGLRPGLPGQPRGYVLVATQVVEQSLDLDLDLLITDIAPISLLLQRAGRCWRHQHLGTVTRPAWADRPRMVVLVPEKASAAGREDAEDGAFPMGWRAVYPVSLLKRTRAMLRRRGTDPVRIPEDVQALVDDVYDDETLAADVEADVAADDVARLGAEMALRTLAKNVVVPEPRDMGRDLIGMTKFEIDLSEHLLATRFGAGSVRVLCCYVDTRGGRWLDRGCGAQPLPEVGEEKDGSFSRKQLRAVMAQTIPVRADSWYGQALPEGNRPPDAWAESFHLRDLVLLPHRVNPDGSVEPAELGGRSWLLDPLKGLVVEK